MAKNGMLSICESYVDSHKHSREIRRYLPPPDPLEPAEPAFGATVC